VKVLPYGDDAVLVEVDASPLAVVPALRALPGVREVVPGARTVLVVFDDGQMADAAALGSALAQAPEAELPRATPGRTVELPVRYDGADLADVAAIAGIAVDEVVARHADGTYTVAFCGFAPGFAYLTGLDPVLQMPRLTQPRASVPAGSVAIAAEYTGVYPGSSPGGWRLLGTTDAPLWDLDRDPPALLVPGTRVRFVPR
jgi:KipI family sensor histidine kinase inhibitor